MPRLTDEREAEIRSNLALSKKLLLVTQFEQGYEQDAMDLLDEVERLRAALEAATAINGELHKIQDEDRAKLAKAVAALKILDDGENCVHVRIACQTLKEIAE